MRQGNWDCHRQAGRGGVAGGQARHNGASCSRLTVAQWSERHTSRQSRHEHAACPMPPSAAQHCTTAPRAPRAHPLVRVWRQPSHKHGQLLGGRTRWWWCTRWCQWWLPCPGRTQRWRKVHGRCAAWWGEAHGLEAFVPVAAAPTRDSPQSTSQQEASSAPATRATAAPKVLPNKVEHAHLL